MIQLTNRDKVKINWNTNRYLYNENTLKEIISAFANKYGIPKENISVVPKIKSEDGTDDNDMVKNITSDNIQDPEFQKKLFLEYLKVNDIKDYDWEVIDRLDNEINEKINYVSYDKHRKFSIKWIKWSNFMSYGTSNTFDFSVLNGLVLLNGIPANRSGKTVFAVDLIHFWLFGKATKDRNMTLSELFNVLLPNETEIKIEGCLNIGGDDYIIKRTVTRPALERRTERSKVSQKVEYYKVIGDDNELLEDYEEQNGETSRHTNKIIKESIGREEDFDLMMCVTGRNIDDLTDKGPTERGRLFMAWMGLLPIEEKYNIANEKYKKERDKLYGNIYTVEDLNKENGECENLKKEYSLKIDGIKKECGEIEKTIAKLEEEKDEISLKLRKIDNDLMKFDVESSQRQLNGWLSEGIAKKNELETILKEIEEIGNIDFNNEEYQRLSKQSNSLSLKKGACQEKIKNIDTLIKKLKDGEYCPVCHSKLKNVDNTKQIAEKEKELSDLQQELKFCIDEIAITTKQLSDMDELNKKYLHLNKIKATKSALESRLEILRSQCREMKEKMRKYQENKEAIDNNTKLRNEINNLSGNITSWRQAKDRKLVEETNYTNLISNNDKKIKENNIIIKKIKEEEVYMGNYKLYLEMIGKNGISKMILKNVLPIINAKVTEKLDGVCDFGITVELNNKNEVDFKITCNGIINDIKSCSGYERTITGLVLRNIVAEISTMPRMNFIILDEVLERSASENYDKIKLLYDRILANYDFIFHVTHNNDLLDWHNQIVTVVKPENGSSSLKEIINTDVMSMTQKKETKKTKRTKK